jgi:D-3-phosphoglycerate dehydrogenase
MKQQNILLTPHVGGWTNESYLKLSMVLADKIVAWYQNVRSKKGN